MVDLNILAEQCDEKIQNGNEEDIRSLLETVKVFTSEEHSDEKRSCAYYLLGNLHGKLASLLQENASGWRKNISSGNISPEGDITCKEDDFPINLSAEINYLRQAKSLVSGQAELIKNEITTNLANALAHQRRNIEILNSYKCDFELEGDAPFVSSLSKARELLWISKFLNGESHQNLYDYEAFLLLKRLKGNIHNTDYQSIVDTINNDPKILHLLEYGEEFFNPLADWQTKHKSEKYEPKEKAYRKWCLQERLFINPINDITTEWIADQDILQFPNHTVKIGDGPYFAASFSALKREFCFARYMAYEGIHQIHPKFETDKLYLVNTLDYVDYSGSTEKIKSAFRICFSVLDSLATIMNKYFGCNSKKPYFTPCWIEKNFKDYPENYFIDALYWLSCDLFDNEKNGAPNPQEIEIRKMRNAIEHGWLRVAERECSIWDKDSDFAYLVTPQELQNRTLDLLRLVRAAMLYLTFAIKLNENSKKSSDGIVVQSPISVMKDEFIPHL